MERFRTVLPGLLLWAALAPGVTQASQVRPVNLEQMTERAGRIFSGRCVETGVIVDPMLGAEVTVATFQVERAIKGDAGGRVTIRMLGGAAGVPRFQPGEDVVLFLYGESRLGLTSPVGLGQGRFSVMTDKLGRRVAINDFANRNLLQGLTPAGRSRLGPALQAAEAQREIEPAALLDMAETLLATAP
jgi:hypothetical protein